MRSKSWLLLLLAPFVLAACDPGPYYKPEENIIGEKLKDVTSLNNDVGNELNKTVTYDPTINRIHQFDLNTMKVERSLPVVNSGTDHTVLYDLSGNYVIDFTQKNMTIFDRFDRATNNPIRFVGKPKSAAFRPGSGLLVVYDDLGSVGLLKLDGNGLVQKSWVGGPVIGTNTSIAAGDIDSSGRLVAAMSDGSFCVVDLDQSMTQKQWVYTRFNTTLTDIKWVAPIRGQANKVFVAANDKLAIVDVVNQTVDSTVDVETDNIIKYSKSLDGHVLTQQWATWNREAEIKIWYVSGAQILSKSVFYQANFVTHTRLDIANDNWSIVDAQRSAYNREIPADKRNRVVKQWRFSDLLAVYIEKVPDRAKLELASRSVFALYPNKLGWAINYDLLNLTKQEAKHFNIPYIR